MIKWLEGNPVGITLASICGAMLLIMLLLAVVWTLPPAAPEPEALGEESIPTLEVPELEDSEPLEAYSVITERPVFNESRQPVIDSDGIAGDEDDLLAEEDVDAPEVELSGVIITPSIRMVTLRDRELSESLVAFEGQPLEGNYGSWHVSRISPREITLSSGTGEELQLQLQVHDQKIEEPPEPEPAKREEPAQVAGNEEREEDGQPLSRAEEIRQRIAERREELRRAAEEKEQGQEQDQAGEKRPDYRTAIQSMISGSRSNEEKDENQR